MRLYPRRENTDHVTAGGTRYEAADDGGFDFPPDLTGLLHSSHVNGEQQWETSIERQRRLIEAEAARRADPRTLLDAVEKLVAQAEQAPAKPRAKAAADK